MLDQFIQTCHDIAVEAGEAPPFCQVTIYAGESQTCARASSVRKARHVDAHVHGRPVRLGLGGATDLVLAGPAPDVVAELPRDPCQLDDDGLCVHPDSELEPRAGAAAGSRDGGR
jgi:hypothetical protein